MPFNENGTFERVHNWTQDKSNNIPITASRMDAEDDGFADGLSQTLLRDGSVALTGNLKAGNHKITGLKNGTADTDAATIGQLNTVQGNAVLLTGDQTVAGVKTFTSSPIAPTPLANDDSTKVATTAWVNTIGNNVVHKTGDETILGYKTFSNITLMNGIRQYSNNVTKGTVPSSTQYINMYMTDSSQASGDANAMGLFRTIVNPDNTVYSQLQAFKNEADSTAMGHLRVTYDTTNNTYFASMGGSSSGTNWSLTRETNNTAVQTIPTMGWVNNPATSTNVVHRSGNETIGGSKTFTSSPYVSNGEPRLFLRNNDITRGTVPSTKEITAINFQDTTGDWYAYVQGIYDTNKSTKVVIGAKKSINSSDSSSVMISVGYDGSGNPYTYAPTPSDTITTSGTQIATTGWVNSTGNNIVHLTGTETITGAKTFTSNIKIENTTPVFVTKISNLTKGATPSDTVISEISFNDKGGTNNVNHLGLFGTRIGTTGNVNSYIRAYKNATSSTDFEEISITYPTSSSPYTYAPTPTDTTSASSTQIATVGWVNSTNNNVVHRSGTETITGAKTFTNDVSIANDNPYIELHDNDFVKGNLPSSEPVYAIYVQDKTSGISQSNRLGVFTTHIQTNGTVWSGFAAYKNVANSTDAASIRVYYPTSGSPYTYAPNPTDTTSTSSQQIATVGWVNNPLIATNIVHRTGDETVGGVKTFSSQAIFEKANGIQLKGTNHYYTLRSIGNTPEGCALLLDNSSSSIAFNATDNRITIGSTAIPAYAIAPTDTYSSTSGTQIATTGWVGSNFVNLAGTQTISGGKTFTSNLYVNNGDPRVFLKHSSAIKGTAPSSTLVSSYQVRDKNNELLGSVHTQYYSDKSILTQIVAYKANNSSDTASSRISVGYDTNGNVVTAAPASDVNNSIVTTINKSKAENGYYQLGNGLIIQWGKTTTLNNNPAIPVSITLPVAFTSTDYKVVMTVDNGTSTGNEYGLYIVSKSKTEFTAVGRGFEGGAINKPAAFIAVGY